MFYLMLAMRRIVKRALGRCVVPLAQKLPRGRRFLRPIGARTSEGFFGDRIVSIQTTKHRSLRLTNLDESYLAFQLFWHGGHYYEPITRALVEVLLQPGDVFLDIGAHIGFFSLTAALSIDGLKVIAFEPNPKNFRILKANAAINGLANLACEPVAISDQEGTATLYLTESDMSASLMKDFQAEDTQQIDSIEVRTATLDSYLERHGVQGPLLIKVDIEGYEPAFFRGAAKTIAKHKPDIILEVLYDQEPELVARLKSLGYHFYPITDEGLFELPAPRLIKRFPFLFLNHLLSTKPKHELAAIFNRVGEAIRGIDLLETSKHFPKEQWPSLWQAQPQTDNTRPRARGQMLRD